MKPRYSSSTTRVWRAAVRGSMLESAGYEVIEAEDGMAAIERYFVDKPDVVMLDLVMKGMYGLEVLAKLRELDPAARVVVVSADVQTSSQRDGARRRRARLSDQAGRARAHAGDGGGGLEGGVIDGADRHPAGRAHRAAEHRLRPRGRVAVAADRAAGAARSAASAIHPIDELTRRCGR